MATHQGQDKQIYFGGIVRNTSDSTCKDGEFDEIINLHYKDGHLTPIKSFASVEGSENINIDYTYIFIHKNNYQHMIGYKDGALWYFANIGDGVNSEKFVPLDEPQSLCTISLDKEIGIQYAQTGNLLTVIDGSGLKYLYYKSINGNLKYQCLLRDYNGGVFDTNIPIEGQIDFRLAPILDSNGSKMSRVIIGNTNGGDDDNISSINEQAVELIKLSRNTSKKKGEHTGYFFVTTAVKDYSDNYILINRPVLINPPQDYESRFGDTSKIDKIVSKHFLELTIGEGANSSLFQQNTLEGGYSYFDIPYNTYLFNPANINRYNSKDYRFSDYGSFRVEDTFVFYEDYGWFKHMDGRIYATQDENNHANQFLISGLFIEYGNLADRRDAWCGWGSYTDGQQLVGLDYIKDLTCMYTYQNPMKHQNNSYNGELNTVDITNNVYGNAIAKQYLSPNHWSVDNNVKNRSVCNGEYYVFNPLFYYIYHTFAGGGTEQRVKCSNTPHKLQYFIHNEIPKEFEDIISSIDILVTEEVEPFFDSYDDIDTNLNYSNIGANFIESYINNTIQILWQWQRYAVFAESAIPKHLDIDLIKSKLTGLKNFYCIQSINYNDIKNKKGVWCDVEFKQHDKLLNLTTSEAVEITSFNRNSFIPKTSIMYNGRLHVANYSQCFFRGFPLNYFISTNNTLGSITYYHGQKTASDKYFSYDKIMEKYNKPVAIVKTTIKTDDGDIIVSRCMAESFSFSQLNPFISYPDTRATKIEITLQRVYNRQHSFTLEKYYREFLLQKHDTFDLAYYISEDLNPINIDCVYYEEEVTEEDAERLVKTNFDCPPQEINSTDKINYIKVSDVEDPLSFRDENTYVIGNEGIIGLATNNIALSSGQAGSTPLLVFSKDGIYGLFVDASGEVAYTNSRPISRFVCNDWRTITYTDLGIAFSTDIGVMLLSGSECLDISDVLEGKYYDFTNTQDEGYLQVADKAADTTALVKLKDNLTKKTFIDFIREGCKIGFDYYNRELWVSGVGDNDQYSYIAKDGLWVKSTIVADEFINNYPDTYILKNGKLSVLGKELAGNDRQETMFLTRPIKFGTQEFKQAYRAILRGKLNLKNDIAFDVKYDEPDTYWRENALRKEIVECNEETITVEPYDKNDIIEISCKNNDIKTIYIYDNRFFNFEELDFDVKEISFGDGETLTLEPCNWYKINYTKNGVVYKYFIFFMRLFVNMEEDFDPSLTYKPYYYQEGEVEIYSDIFIRYIRSGCYQFFNKYEDNTELFLKVGDSYRIVTRQLAELMEGEEPYWDTSEEPIECEYLDEEIVNIIEYHSNFNFIEEDLGTFVFNPTSPNDYESEVFSIDTSAASEYDVLRVNCQDVVSMLKSNGSDTSLGELDEYKYLNTLLPPITNLNSVVCIRLVVIDGGFENSHEFIYKYLSDVRTYGDMIKAYNGGRYDALPTTNLVDDKLTLNAYTNYHIIDKTESVSDYKEYHFFNDNEQTILFKDFNGNIYDEPCRTLQNQSEDFLANKNYRVTFTHNNGDVDEYYLSFLENGCKKNYTWEELSIPPSDSDSVLVEATDDFVRDNTSQIYTIGKMFKFITTDNNQTKIYEFRLKKASQIGDVWLYNKDVRAALAGRPCKIEGEIFQEIDDWSAMHNGYNYSFQKERDLTVDHAGIYLFGSYDCRRWVFIGGNELKGEFRDLGCVSHRLDFKYFRILFVGKLSYDSYIDYIDMSVISNLLGGRLR